MTRPYKAAENLPSGVITLWSQTAGRNVWLCMGDTYRNLTGNQVVKRTWVVKSAPPPALVIEVEEWL